LNLDKAGRDLSRRLAHEAEIDLKEKRVVRFVGTSKRGGTAWRAMA
jgi:hypothetical protein